MTLELSDDRPEVWLSLPGDWTEFRVGHRAHHELIAAWLEERAELPQPQTLATLDALAAAGGRQLLTCTDPGEAALVVTAWPLPGSADSAHDDLARLTRSHGGGQQEVLQHTQGYDVVGIPRSGPHSASIMYLITHPVSDELFLLDVTRPRSDQGGIDRELYDAVAAAITWQPVGGSGA